MAGFTESVLSKKLEDLNASQQSIQTLSLWLIHHRKHYATIVKTWIRELISADEGRQLTLMYLANDVIQNSKKKGPEYGKQFGTVLQKAFEIMGGDSCGAKTRSSLLRILNIWVERGVYDKRTIDGFKKALGVLSNGPSKSSSSPAKKKRREMPKEKKRDTPPSMDPLSPMYPDDDDVDGAGNGDVQSPQNGEGVMHITLSPAKEVIDPPEPEELIKVLVELENSASSDATVREKIANLPPEVSELRLLSKLEDRKMGEALLRQVNEAVTMLIDYNDRLTKEMTDRKKVATMLQDYIQSQRGLLIQAENRQEDCKEKLRKITLMRHDLKMRLQNLPDMKQLPNVTGGSLAPLPAPSDLFIRSSDKY